MGVKVGVVNAGVAADESVKVSGHILSTLFDLNKDLGAPSAEALRRCAPSKASPSSPRTASRWPRTWLGGGRTSPHGSGDATLLCDATLLFEDDCNNILGEIMVASLELSLS